MTYEEWERTVPEAITGDVVWKMRVYRLGLFAADVGWEDVSNPTKTPLQIREGLLLPEIS